MFELVDSEVEAIARGIFRNELYPSWRVPIALLPSVFTVMNYLTEEQRELWRVADITTLIGDQSKAGPVRATQGGWPVFAECRLLTRTDTERVLTLLKRMMASTFHRKRY